MMLRDFKENPYRCIKEVSNYLVHELALVDMNGLPPFLASSTTNLSTIMSSLATLI